MREARIYSRLEKAMEAIIEKVRENSFLTVALVNYKWYDSQQSKDC